MKKPWIYGRGARFYDLIHHLQLLWSDDVYRSAVVKEAGASERFLDLGTGTALTAIQACLTYPSSCVIGVDISQEMLVQARQNLRRYGLEQRVQLVRADLTNLPFESGSFTAVISCYGLGGVENIGKAFEEVSRVAATGAIISIAEMAEPPTHGLRKLIHKKVIEPWIRFFWGFRDLGLPYLFEENSIEVKKVVHFTYRVFGSTMLVKGVKR